MKYTDLLEEQKDLILNSASYTEVSKILPISEKSLFRWRERIKIERKLITSSFDTTQLYEGHLKYCEGIDNKLVKYLLSGKTILNAALKYRLTVNTIDNKLSNIIDKASQQGYAPKFDMDNPVPENFVVKGTSTLYDAEGNKKIQWVKTDIKKEQQLQDIKSTISELVNELEGKYTPTEYVMNGVTSDKLFTTYISNDLHIGALSWAEETLDRDYDLNIATDTIKSAYNYLMNTSPNTKVGIIADLGDLTEVDSFTQATPKSGNLLDVDGRYQKILKIAYKSLIYGIEAALQKHEIVHFIGINGNHDVTTAIAVKEIILAYFRNEPRLIVDDSPSPIKYYHQKKTLIQFAHGDGLKMRDAGEVMVVDKRDIISETVHNYALFGHTHKDAVYDGRVCKSESFRNIAPLNAWASHAGYRINGLGTMNSITYSEEHGEISRVKFNVGMSE